MSKGWEVHLYTLNPYYYGATRRKSRILTYCKNVLLASNFWRFSEKLLTIISVFGSCTRAPAARRLQCAAP